MKVYKYIVLFILIFPIFESKAQLCNGTLGAPIFLETFGAGPGPGAALPVGVTNYTYATGWPNDGQYAISNTSNPAPQNPHWYTGKDHTGDPNGYMFVANASYSPSEFYRNSVTGLCPNTNYVFSAWIANVNNFQTIAFCKANDPPYVFANVKFKVRNSVTNKVDSINTGNIAPDSTNMVWHQFGFTFSTGPNQTSVILSMVNNSNGGCGNDLVIDDISFRPCGPSTSIAAIPYKTAYCTGDSVLLQSTIGPGYSNPVYQWQYSSDGGLTWQDLIGKTTKDLLLKPILLSDAGKYRLVLAENGNINSTKCRIITSPLTIKTVQSPAVIAAPTPSAICIGNSSILLASGASTYTWNGSTNAATMQVSPVITTTYAVIGTDVVSGCIGTATTTVTVNPASASAVVTGPDSICSGNSVTLTAISPGGTYYWYNALTGGNLLFTGNSFITPVLNTTVTYYVEVVSAAGCKSNSRTPVTVVVNTLPVSPVVSGPDSICAGNSATLTAISPSGTYYWYNALTGGNLLFTGNSFVTPVLNSTVTYYVEVVSAAGCKSNSRTPVTVAIYNTPVSPVVSGPDSICSGNSVTLKVISPGGTYYWYNALTGGNLLFTGSNFITPVLNTTVTYYVEVVSAAGCKSNSRTPVTVAIYNTPVSPVVTGPDSICAGNSVTLKAISPGGTFYWYNALTGGNLLFTGSSFVTPVLNTTVTYYVEVVSAAGCKSNSRTPVTVVVNTLPVSPVVSGPDSICAGNLVTLKAISPGGTYYWYNALTGGNLLFTGSSFITPVLNNTATYYVEVVSAAGCKSNSRTPVKVFVSAVQAQFTASPLSGPSPLKVEFTNLSTGTLPLFYYWNLGDNYTSTSKDESHIYSTNNEQGSIYQVILIAKNNFGCADTFKVAIIVDSFSELIIPNVFTPNYDNINDLFTVKSIGLKTIHAQLFNRWGLKLYEWNDINGGWDGKTSSGDSVPSGTYFYIIKAKGYDGKEYDLKGSFSLFR